MCPVHTKFLRPGTSATVGETGNSQGSWGGGGGELQTDPGSAPGAAGRVDPPRPRGTGAPDPGGSDMALVCFFIVISPLPLGRFFVRGKKVQGSAGRGCGPLEAGLICALKAWDWRALCSRRVRDGEEEEIRGETISVVFLEKSGRVMYSQIASVPQIPMPRALT